MYGKRYDPGMGPILSGCRWVIGLGWGIHTVRGGIDPGNLRFRFRFVGVVDVLEL